MNALDAGARKNAQHVVDAVAVGGERIRYEDMDLPIDLHAESGGNGAAEFVGGCEFIHRGFHRAGDGGGATIAVQRSGGRPYPSIGREIDLWCDQDTVAELDEVISIGLQNQFLRLGYGNGQFSNGSIGIADGEFVHAGIEYGQNHR